MTDLNVALLEDLSQISLGKGTKVYKRDGGYIIFNIHYMIHLYKNTEESLPDNQLQVYLDTQETREDKLKSILNFVTGVATVNKFRSVRFINLKNKSLKKLLIDSGFYEDVDPFFNEVMQVMRLTSTEVVTDWVITL